MLIPNREEALVGDFLQLICEALQRNRVGGLKNAAIVLDPDEETAVRKPPQSQTSPFIPIAKRKDF